MKEHYYEGCKVKFKVAIKSAVFLKSKCNHINNSNGKTIWNQQAYKTWQHNLHRQYIKKRFWFPNNI